MPITSNPYLTFRNNDTKEAMAFYASIFGGEPVILPLQGMDGMPDDESRTMHACLKTAEITLMGSDNLCPDAPVAGNLLDIALMVSKDDEARGREIFQQLAAGGKVVMPLEKQEWGDLYGGLIDRYGFSWVMNIEQG